MLRWLGFSSTASATNANIVADIKLTEKQDKPPEDVNPSTASPQSPIKSRFPDSKTILNRPVISHEPIRGPETFNTQEEYTKYLEDIVKRQQRQLQYQSTSIHRNTETIARLIEQTERKVSRYRQIIREKALKEAKDDHDEIMPNMDHEKSFSITTKQHEHETMTLKVQHWKKLYEESEDKMSKMQEYMDLSKKRILEQEQACHTWETRVHDLERQLYAKENAIVRGMNRLKNEVLNSSMSSDDGLSERSR